MLHWQLRSHGRVCEQKCCKNIWSIMQNISRCCKNIATIFQKHCKNIALHSHQWSPGGVCELRKEWRQWGYSVSSTWPHTINISSLVFVFSFVFVFVRKISFMRRFKKLELEVFCRFYRGKFFTAGNVLMEGSNWKCINYLILKTIYPSGLHFWASCPQNQMAR